MTYTQKIDVVGALQITFDIGNNKVTDNILIARGINLGNVILLGHPSCIKNKMSLCPPQRGIFIEGVDSLVFVPYAKVEKERSLMEGKSGNCKEVVLLKELLKSNYEVKATLKEDIQVYPGVP